MNAQLDPQGDDIPALTALRARCHTLDRDDARPVRGVVWGADLRGLAPRQARARLKQAASDALHDAEQRAGASHLIVVFTHDAPRRAAGYGRLADALASRLRSRLERGRGREWSVVFVDASGCDDAPLLDTRLSESIASAAGSVGDTAVDWDEIRTEPIHRAAARHAL